MNAFLRIVRSQLDETERDWSGAFRIAVVLSAILASGLLAYRQSLRLTSMVVGIVIGTGAAAIFLQFPSLGPVTLIIATLVFPFSIGTGTGTDLNAAVLLVSALSGLWIFDKVALRAPIRFLPSRPLRPLLLLVFATTLAFGLGQLPWFYYARSAPLPAQLGGLAVFVLSAAAFFLVAHQVRDVRWLRWMVWVFLALGGVHVAGRLIPEIGQYTFQLFQRGATGSLFWTWLVALAFSQALFNKKLAFRWRLALGALVLGAFYVNLVQAHGWTSGWLPPLAALVVILLVGAPRPGGVLAVIAAVLLLINSQVVNDLLNAGDNEYSLMTRLEAWRIMGEIIKVNPLLGLGPSNYYWYTPLFPILGYAVSFNSHNNYVDIIAQTGILGLACFLWFAWEVWHLGWRLRSAAPQGFERAYVYAALGGLAGTLVAGMLGDWVLPFVYNIGLAGFRASVLGWLYLGGIVVIEHLNSSTNKNNQTIQKPKTIQPFR